MYRDREYGCFFCKFREGLICKHNESSPLILRHFNDLTIKSPNDLRLYIIGEGCHHSLVRREGEEMYIIKPKTEGFVFR
jgi:hypothetical protein